MRNYFIYFFVFTLSFINVYSFNRNKDSLILTPNESFFSPVGTLRAHLKEKKTGSLYNKRENYNYIYNWKKETDTILFHINIKKTGALCIQPKIIIPKSQNGSVFSISLNKVSKEITLESNQKNNSYSQNSVTFSDVKPGFYAIKLQLKHLKDKINSIGKLFHLKLTGTASKNASVEMRRYRPFAVHCAWQSDAVKPIEISVHELTVINTRVNVYQPITTPFGYTGSPWSLKKQTFGGYNFSLWSYGAKDPVPPFYQESHLISVGENLRFSSYGHEGTGVKPRGKNPFENSKSNTQIIAVRKLPGKIYDTFWSYYLHPTKKVWTLYGSGKKYNKSGKKTGLVTGAFVEVAGPASAERSGHEIRESQYSGWQMDVDGNWFSINKMIGTSKQNFLSYRNWRSVGNKFSMQMGSFNKPGIPKKTITIQNPVPIPYYLKGEYIKQLYKMPAILTIGEPTKTTNNSTRINFKVDDFGTNPNAQLFYGTSDGLTKEIKWQSKKNITIKKGDNSIKIEGLKSNKKYFYRIKLKNNEGVTWAFNTHSFTTKF